MDKHRLVRAPGERDSAVQRKDVLTQGAAGLRLGDSRLSEGSQAHTTHCAPPFIGNAQNDSHRDGGRFVGGRGRGWGWEGRAEGAGSFWGGDVLELDRCALHHTGDARNATGSTFHAMRSWPPIKAI